VLAWLPAVAAVIAVAAAWLLGRDPQGLVSRDWNGLAFVATSLTIAMVVLSIFLGLYPRVMVSTLGSANDLTVANTASSSYTLRVMTVVAVILLPVVLAYQGVDLLRVPAPDRPLGRVRRPRCRLGPLTPGPPAATAWPWRCGAAPPA
jgi:hypothetical protein